MKYNFASIQIWDWQWIKDTAAPKSRDSLNLTEIFHQKVYHNSRDAMRL